MMQHIPNYYNQNIQSNEVLELNLPAYRLAGSKIRSPIIGDKNKIVAFKASSAPGMSGCPILFRDSNKDLYYFAVYNGPAAVPGHRFLAYMYMWNSFKSKAFFR